MTNLEAARKMLDKIGNDWHNDWSDFDGRTLMHQLYAVNAYLDPSQINEAYIGDLWFEEEEEGGDF